MSDTNPLAGLTADQADEAIGRLEVKIDQQEATLKAAKAHLRDLKAARKTLTDPQPPGNGTRVQAGTAQVGVEAVDV